MKKAKLQNERRRLAWCLVPFTFCLSCSAPQTGGDDEDAPLTEVVAIPEVVGTWYLRADGLLRQYTFYEGGTYEAYEGPQSDVRFTTGRYAYSPSQLTLTPDAGGERVRVEARVSGDTLTISTDAYAVRYLALATPYINPPRAAGTWVSGDNTLTLRADNTFTYGRMGASARRQTTGTYILITDPSVRRLYLRYKESTRRNASYVTRVLPVRYSDHNGHAELRIEE